MLVDYTKFVDETLHILETFCSRGKKIQSCDVGVHVFGQNILILVDILLENLELCLNLIQSSHVFWSLTNLITVLKNINEEKNFASQKFDGICGGNETCADVRLLLGLLRVHCLGNMVDGDSFVFTLSKLEI